MLLSLIAFILLAGFAGLVIFAAVRDVVSFTIPNRISIALALLFVPAMLAAGLGWAQAGLHLFVGAGVLALGIGMFALRWIGGGDAKLLAAAALWAGWPGVLPFLALTAIFGGVFVLLLLIARRMFGSYAEAHGIFWPILQRTGDVPYGVGIAAAALVFLPGSEIGAALIAAML